MKGRFSIAKFTPHRDPIVFVDTVESYQPGAIVCSSRITGPWDWPQMLEGAAQCAGILVGLEHEHESVVAQYRHMAIHGLVHVGALRFAARRERRFLGFYECHIEVRDLPGAIIISGSLTLAPRLVDPPRTPPMQSRREWCLPSE